MTDRALLLAADDDLAPRRLLRVRRHLARCAVCAARARALSRSDGVIADCRDDGPRALPPPGVARARLRARLAEEQRGSAAAVAVPRWVAACALVAATVGLAWLPGVRMAPVAPATMPPSEERLQRPRPDLTPGVARAVTAADVCGADRRNGVVPVAVAVQRGVFESYGADFARASEYELDYLITPELGGATDVRNLWPQPFAQTAWNAYVKDELELHLHRLVCDGALDLVAAQREIAGDWIAAYKHRFATDRPRRDYAASPLTADDADLLRGELAELGVSPPAHASDGVTLMALLQTARRLEPPRGSTDPTEGLIQRID